ncbi:hypothetical protein AC578_39, partial [Pseudocercospora eumusae]
LLGIYYVLPLLRNFVDNKPLITHIDLATTSNYNSVLEVVANNKPLITHIDLATTSNYKGVARGGLEVALSLISTPSTPALDLATTSNYRGV